MKRKVHHLKVVIRSLMDKGVSKENGTKMVDDIVNDILWIGIRRGFWVSLVLWNVIELFRGNF